MYILRKSNSLGGITASPRCKSQTFTFIAWSCLVTIFRKHCKIKQKLRVTLLVLALLIFLILFLSVINFFFFFCCNLKSAYLRLQNKGCLVGQQSIQLTLPRGKRGLKSRDPQGGLQHNGTKKRLDLES